MKTAYSLNFKPMGYTTSIWGWRTWLWNWNVSSLVVEELTKPKKLKGEWRRDKSGWKRDSGGGWRNSKSFRYSCKQHFAFSFWYVEVYINNQQIFNSYGLYEHKSYIFNNFKVVISGYKWVLHWKGMTKKNFMMKLWKRLCMNLFLQGEWKWLVDPKVSSCMANWGLSFSPLLNCGIQTWNLGYDWWEPDLIFTWLATSPKLVLELLIARSTLVVLCRGRLSQKKEWTCLHIFRWSWTNWRL